MTMRPTPILCFRASLIARATKAPLIHIRDATFYRRQPSEVPTEEEQLTNRPLFPNLNFLLPSENTSQQYWAICGASNAGKTTFMEILRGQHLCFPPNARTYPYLSSEEIAAKDHRLRYPGRAIQYVGFDTKEKGLSGRGTYLSARYESRRETTDFSVADFLKGNTELNALPIEEAMDTGLFDRIVEDMRLKALLTMPLTNLSNGQTRRARIAKALLGKPELLLLDEPFMGLDPPTTRSLSPILYRLASTDSPRILLSLRPQDRVPDWITHLLYLGQDLKITLQGPKAEVGQALIAEANALKQLEDDVEEVPRFCVELGHQLIGEVKVPPKKRKQREPGGRCRVQDGVDFDPHRDWRHEITYVGEPVLEMEGVVIKYGEKQVLGNWRQKMDDAEDAREGLWWTVHRGQRWGVFGPNGSGKTTLLSLILSDHPQAYSVPMKIFGRSRLPSPGQPGISVFDIQRRIGHSSPEVHGFFPRRLTVRQTLESAYADTPLGWPTLSIETDKRVDACLRWFQAELNPSLGMHPVLKEDLLRRGRRPAKDRQSLRGNVDVYREIVSQEEFQLGQDMADSVEWADDMTFGDMPFSAQRVALFIRAVVAQPDIVVLDEAFSGMDDYVRDKCLLFLDHGESKRLSLYTGPKAKDPSFDKYTAIERPLSERDEYYVIKEGLTENQALIVVSHVKEEVPASVREWIFLPESETGAPCTIGSVIQNPIMYDVDLWDQIWGFAPLQGQGKRRANVTTTKQVREAAPTRKRSGRPRKEVSKLSQSKP